ncbi:unnamed protein product [Amoebophrya sp. A120]|nr:unnamed protein product [Amoebophrya sp. A120]|eukprot:GSA120T00020129001.1
MFAADPDCLYAHLQTLEDHFGPPGMHVIFDEVGTDTKTATLFATPDFVMDQLLQFFCKLDPRVVKAFLGTPAGAKFRRNREFMCELVRANGDNYDEGSPSVLANDQDLWLLAWASKVASSDFSGESCNAREITDSEDFGLGESCRTIKTGRAMSLLRDGTKWVCTGTANRPKIPLMLLYAMGPTTFSEKNYSSHILLGFVLGDGEDSDNEMRPVLTRPPKWKRTRTSTAIHAFGAIARLALACGISGDGLDKYLESWTRGEHLALTPFSRELLPYNRNFDPKATYIEYIGPHKTGSSREGASAGNTADIDGVPDILRAQAHLPLVGGAGAASEFNTTTTVRGPGRGRSSADTNSGAAALVRHLGLVGALREAFIRGDQRFVENLGEPGDFFFSGWKKIPLSLQEIADLVCEVGHLLPDVSSPRRGHPPLYEIVNVAGRVFQPTGADSRGALAPRPQSSVSTLASVADTTLLKVLQKDGRFMCEAVYGSYFTALAFEMFTSPKSRACSALAVTTARMFGFLCFPRLDDDVRLQQEVILAAAEATLKGERLLYWPQEEDMWRFAGFLDNSRNWLAANARHLLLAIAKNHQQSGQGSAREALPLVVAALACEVPDKVWELLRSKYRSELAPEVPKKFLRSVLRTDRPIDPQDEDAPDEGPLCDFWMSLSPEQQGDPSLLRCIAETESPHRIDSKFFDFLKSEEKVQAVQMGPNFADLVLESSDLLAKFPPEKQFSPEFWLNVLRHATSPQERRRKYGYYYADYQFPWVLRRDAAFLHKAVEIDFCFATKVASTEVLADRRFVLAVIRQVAEKLQTIRSSCSKLSKEQKEDALALRKWSEHLGIYTNPAKSLLKDGALSIDTLLSRTSCANRCDFEIVFAAVQQNGKAIRYAGWALRNDRKIIRAALQHDGLALQHVPVKLLEDEELCLVAVSQNGLALKHCPMKMRMECRAVVLAAVKQNPEAIFFARGEKFLGVADEDIFQAALKSTTYVHYLAGTYLDVADDHPLVSRRAEFLYEVAIAGNVEVLSGLKWHDKNTLQNFDRMLKLVQIDGTALAYTPLRHNFKLAMAAVTNTGKALRFVCPGLLRSPAQGKQLMLAALRGERGRKAAVKAIPREFLQDEEIFAAVKENRRLYEPGEVEDEKPIFSPSDFEGITLDDLDLTVDDEEQSNQENENENDAEQDLQEEAVAAGVDEDAG